MGLVVPTASPAQTNSVRLERVTVLTSNLDSAMRSFLARGFRFEPSDFAPYGPVTVRLPSGVSVQIESSDPKDLSDWKTRALSAFGNHVSGLSLAVDDLPGVARRLDSMRISHGPITPHGFGLAGIAPLDVVFVPRNMTLATGAIGKNGYRRISWLILTASDASQAMLRRVFDALGLRRLHEGCCDYWLTGPVDARTAIRFEIPVDERSSTSATPEKSFKPEGEWLSIEDGGIVFGY